jgi:excisionase family DNA binding protein
MEKEFRYCEQDASDIRKTLEAKMEYMGQGSGKSGFKPLLDTKQAARLLGVCSNTIHNWIKKYPDFPFNKVGRKYTFNEEELRSRYYGKEVS